MRAYLKILANCPATDDARMQQTTMDQKQLDPSTVLSGLIGSVIFSNDYCRDQSGRN